MTKDEKRRDLIKNQDWGNTPLKDYLRYDRWKERWAWFILVGYEGNPETKGKHPILAPENDFNEDIDYEKMSPEGKINFDRLESFWKNTDNYRRENGRPQQYIDWALSKGIRPLWLDWAIEQKLYIPKILKQEASQNKIATMIATTTHSTAWLEIQQAAILQFFSPRPRVDAKKEQVVPWIVLEAKKAGIKTPTSIAEAIFTIIKPLDHSPKVRRVGPIKTQ
jgi:hypothetical protein